MGVLQLGRRKQTRATTASPSIDPGEVARVAYELYEQRGRSDGHDCEDWLKAEALVRRRQAARGGNGSR